MSAAGEGTFTIVSVKNEKLALDINDAHKLTAKRVNDPDTWTVKLDDSTDFCTIVHDTSGLALDLSGRVTDPGNKVQSYKQNGTPAQEWEIQLVKKGGKDGREQYGIKYHADPSCAVTTHGQADGAVLALQIAVKNFEDQKQLWYFTPA